MVLDTYDLAIVGDHLGGLAAAALCAKRGKRVLLFENTEEAVEERLMDYLNAICGGPEKEAGLGRFFHELGFSPFGPLGDDRIHFRPLHPPLQVILPRHRVNIFQDDVARRWEMEREFGKVDKCLDDMQRREEALREVLFRFRTPRAEGRSFAGKLQADLSRLARLRALVREAERESFPDFLRSLEVSPGLADVLTGQVQGVIRLLPASMPWAVGLRSLRVLQGGLFQNASGQSGILNGLKEAFRRFGGECLPLASLEGVELPRKEPARLALAARGSIQAAQAVFDLPMEKNLGYFHPEVVKGLRRRKIDQVDREWNYGHLHLWIRRDWRPECMGKYLVVDPSTDGTGSEMTLFLALQPGERPEDRNALGMEALGFFRDDKAPEKRRQAIWDRLRILMPFLEKSLEGDVSFRHGCFARFVPHDRRRQSLENYFRTGRRFALFRSGRVTFLRNEEYIGTGLAEGLLSGIRSID